MSNAFTIARRTRQNGPEGASPLECPRSGAFRIGMGQPVSRRWGCQDEHADNRTQHARPQVARADVDRHAWAQSQLREGGSIGTQAHLILSAALVIVPGPGNVHAIRCPAGAT